jgi:hypothetical protein
MPNTTTPPIVSGKQVFSTDTVQQYPLGTKVQTRDGREFRYVQAGAADLVVGNVIQAAAQLTDHQAMAPTADVAIGSTFFSVTPGATAGAANLYANGLVIVEVTPGLGYSYAVSGHAAITASVAFQINLYAEDGIQVALTTAASKVTLIANAYKNVIQSPVTTLTGSVVGVAVYPITATQYGYIGVKGIFGTLVKGTPGVGLAVVVPGTAAGAVVIDGAASATQVIGSMMVTGVDGHVQPVFISLP